MNVIWGSLQNKQTLLGKKYSLKWMGRVWRQNLFHKAKTFTVVEQLQLLRGIFFFFFNMTQVTLNVHDKEQSLITKLKLNEKTFFFCIMRVKFFDWQLSWEIVQQIDYIIILQNGFYVFTFYNTLKFYIFCRFQKLYSFRHLQRI